MSSCFFEIVVQVERLRNEFVLDSRVQNCSHVSEYVADLVVINPDLLGHIFCCILEKIRAVAGVSTCGDHLGDVVHEEKDKPDGRELVHADVVCGLVEGL